MALYTRLFQGDPPESKESDRALTPFNGEHLDVVELFPGELEKSGSARWVMFSDITWGWTVLNVFVELEDSRILFGCNLNVEEDGTRSFEGKMDPNLFQEVSATLDTYKRLLKKDLSPFWVVLEKAIRGGLGIYNHGTGETEVVDPGRIPEFRKSFDKWETEAKEALSKWLKIMWQAPSTRKQNLEERISTLLAEF